MPILPRRGAINRWIDRGGDAKNLGSGCCNEAPSNMLQLWSHFSVLGGGSEERFESW